MNASSDKENETYHKNLIKELHSKLKKIYEVKITSQTKKEASKSKLSARERIDYLLDKEKNTVEIAPLAAYEMYKEEGGCPAAGVLVKIGYIQNRLCIVVANDWSIKAGAWFPMTTKKNLRAQKIAMENRIPIIYLVDSAGIYLPLQEELFADREHFGRVFRNNAKMSAMGIPQIAAVMGSCVAGGAYLPVMSDEVIMVEGISHLFLAGSHLVKTAIGENIDNETLGGASTHAEISGVADYKVKTEQEALDKIKELVSKIAKPQRAGFNKANSKPPKKNSKKIYEILPSTNAQSYDMYDLIKSLTDDSHYQEYKAEYGKAIICSYAQLKGWTIGIIANQRKMVKTKKGEIQVGGVIYTDAALKATSFIGVCNQKKIPLLFLQDVSGFMVGSKAEHSGILKAGAKMLSAMANCIVPKFTILIGNSYGAGNYALCGRAYDPRFLLAWPSSRLAVMGALQAAGVLTEIKKKQALKKGKTLSKEEEKDLLNEISIKYENQSSPYYGAARLWIDALIDPEETRNWIDLGIEMANHSPIQEKFNPGII